MGRDYGHESRKGKQMLRIIFWMGCRHVPCFAGRTKVTNMGSHVSSRNTTKRPHNPDPQSMAQGSHAVVAVRFH